MQTLADEFCGHAIVLINYSYQNTKYETMLNSKKISRKKNNINSILMQMHQIRMKKMKIQKQDLRKKI